MWCKSLRIIAVVGETLGGGAAIGREEKQDNVGTGVLRYEAYVA